MALVQCPECGKEISDQALSCPNCGYVMQKVESIEPVATKSAKKIPDKRVITIVCVVVLIAGLLCISDSGLNQDEKLALEDCKILRNMLKDPSSMDIYNIYVRPSEDGGNYDTLVFIDYAAANSYGGKVRNVATFEENTYLGDSNDDEDDFSSQYEYDYYLLASFAYKFYIVRDGEIASDNPDFAKVNVDKIVKAIER